MKTESDSTFVLKIILYMILGAFWLRIDTIDFFGINVAIPFGLLIGLIFASHEHFAIDRKIEYAVLIVSVVVSFFLPTGLII